MHRKARTTLTVIGLLTLASVSRAQVVAGGAITVASASGAAAPASVGAWVAASTWSWWTVRGWYAYFPGTNGIDSTGFEFGLISPVRGFGTKLRPFLSGGVAVTRDRSSTASLIAQPVFSVGAFYNANERWVIAPSVSNGVLGDNGGDRTTRSWSLTFAVGRRF
jgi:hypothetical protein